MGFALLLALGLLWWLHTRGLLLPNLRRLGGSAVGLLLAARLVATGKPLMALVAVAVAYGWWVVQRPPIVDPLTAARALLGVAPGADVATINAAWRRAMSRAHPDAGGDADTTRALLDAREALLEEAKKGPPAGKG
jgi:hypothetical protein